MHAFSNGNIKWAGDVLSRCFIQIYFIRATHSWVIFIYFLTDIFIHFMAVVLICPALPIPVRSIIFSFDDNDSLKSWNTQCHGWLSSQAESKIEAKFLQGGATLRPNRSHCYIHIHTLVIWWNTEMNSAWAAPPRWDSASVLDSAWGEGHPWMYAFWDIFDKTTNISKMQTYIYWFFKVQFIA